MSRIVSPISVHQQQELLAKLEAAGLTGPLAQKVIESRGNTLAREVVVLIRGQTLAPSYTVTVDYSKSVEQLVQAGHYDWANDSITSRNFPSPERGVAQVDIFLLNFDRNISGEGAIQAMNQQGLRPATLKELLALGAVHPDLQRENPIVALGSTWRLSDGGVVVPYLFRGGSSRFLHLAWFGGAWGPHCRFAARRK